MSWNNAANMNAFAQSVTQTLSQSRIAVRKRDPFARHRMVVLLDWDNTILPTLAIMPLYVAWVQSRTVPTELGEGLQRLHPSDKVKMLEIEKHTMTMLQTMDAVCTKERRQFHIYIVSNSEIPWVPMTCAWFFPNLYQQWFMNERLFVIHAQNLSIKRTKDTCEWKRFVFAKVLRSHLTRHLSEKPVSNERLHIVNIGDSDDEHEALRIVLKQANGLPLPTTIRATFVLLENNEPNTAQINGQLQWICANTKIFREPFVHQCINMRALQPRAKDKTRDVQSAHTHRSSTTTKTNTASYNRRKTLPNLSSSASAR